MPRFYRKELPETPVYVNGAPIRFDILKTEDPTLISHLDACIREQRAGIIAITEEEYEVEAKKKANGKSSAYDSSPRLRRQELSARPNLAAGGADDTARAFQRVAAMPQVGGPGTSPVSGRQMPDPIQVPSPEKFSGVFVKPPTAFVQPPS